VKMVMTTIVLAAVVGTGSDDEYSSSTALISFMFWMLCRCEWNAIFYALNVWSYNGSRRYHLNHNINESLSIVNKRISMLHQKMAISLFFGPRNGFPAGHNTQDSAKPNSLFDQLHRTSPVRLCYLLLSLIIPTNTLHKHQLSTYSLLVP